MKPKAITKCRVCFHDRLKYVGGLGKIAVNNFTKKPDSGLKWPLELVYCPRCTLLQLKHDPPTNLYKDHYWYESAINPVIVKDLKEIASYAKGNYFVDIGANDGTLLSFVPKTINRIGIEPAKNLYNKLKQHCELAISDYWHGLKDIKADVITAIAMLYDLTDPNKFISDIKRSLADNGIFIAQLMTLHPMIENNDIGNICHEHIEYYSYKSLVTLYERNGLEIYKVETNSMNGGSYRIFARHYKKGSIEFNEQVYTLKDFKTFFQRAENSKRLLFWFLEEAKELGLKVVGYAASTKANTILQWYGITRKELPFITEVNMDKVGRYTVGSKIPIVNSTKYQKSDYLWVFPYGFIDSFRKKEKDYKGRFVVSMPEFRIYGS